MTNETRDVHRETSGFWRTQEMFLIQEVTNLIGKGLYFDQVARGALHLMSEMLGLNRGRIVLKSQDEDVYRIAYSYGLTTAEAARGRYQLGEGVTGSVIQAGHLVIVQDIDKEPTFLGRAVERSRLPEGVVSFLACPIRVEDRTVGALACHRIRHRDRPLQDDVRILKIVATLLGQLLTLNDRLDRRMRAIEAREPLAKPSDQAARYGIVGEAPALLRAIAQIEQVADATASVLLLGESGTGKELFAHALHAAGPRKSKPFMKVNCAAIPESLFESELFGHERGAFTGATEARAGWFEQASGGTIFLDEIGEMPLLLQTKLLRTLQEGVVMRLGGKREIRVDMRLVAATNRDLSLAVERGDFREDLFYRLNVIPIQLPSLSQRAADIPQLARHFLNRANASNRREVALTADAMHYLSEQSWPGNVRQLSNFIERLVLLASAPVLGRVEVASLLADRAFDIAAPRQRPPEAHFAPAAMPVRPYLPVKSHTAEDLRRALELSGGNKARAAQQLGLTERQFFYRLKKLGLEPARS
ncbi:sigma 54-interacting transcriptional regulator [Methylopila henanensis]|uniref:Sigma 54-interacting transcriptional regulator n=1 Tax=Methylopila henanensis TaxID=873516 RepID=A0ABW4K7L9_9HYPH